MAGPQGTTLGFLKKNKTLIGWNGQHRIATPSPGLRQFWAEHFALGTRKFNATVQLVLSR